MKNDIRSYSVHIAVGGLDEILGWDSTRTNLHLIAVHLDIDQGVLRNDLLPDWEASVIEKRKNADGMSSLQLFADAILYVLGVRSLPSSLEGSEPECHEALSAVERLRPRAQEFLSPLLNYLYCVSEEYDLASVPWGSIADKYPDAWKTISTSYRLAPRDTRIEDVARHLISERKIAPYRDRLSMLVPDIVSPSKRRH